MRRLFVLSISRLERLLLFLLIILLLLILVPFFFLLYLLLLIEGEGTFIESHSEGVICRCVSRGDVAVDVEQLVSEPADLLVGVVQLHLQLVVLLNHI